MRVDPADACFLCRGVPLEWRHMAAGGVAVFTRTRPLLVPYCPLQGSELVQYVAWTVDMCWMPHVRAAAVNDRCRTTGKTPAHVPFTSRLVPVPA